MSAASTSSAAPGAATDHHDLYRQIVTSLAAAVYTCDAEGRVTLFNDAAAELWGRKPEIGTDFWYGSWRVFTPEGTPLPLDECPMAVTLRERRPVRGVEILVECPGGVRRRVLPHPSPILDSSGNLIGAVNFLVDVTEQREGQRAQALLAAIVESSDDAIVSKTLEGRITSWNGGAQRIFGYTPEEIVGRHITTLIPPDRHPEEDEILSRLWRGERIEHYQTVRITKTGRLINVSLTVSPIRDSSGRLIGASKVARDITQQKQAEEALRRSEQALAESEARLRALLSVLPVGVYSCDAEGRITFYNRRAAELWGREPDQASTRFCGCERMFWPDGSPIPWERIPMATALTEGKSFRNTEAIVEQPGGKRFHAAVNIDPIRDDSGRVLGAINVFQDVSAEVAAREAIQNHQRMLEEAVAQRTAELEESHRRLRHSERMAALGTLSAGLGHDMGNLLLPLRISLEALTSAGLPEPLRAEVDRIRTSAQYLQQLAVGLRMLVTDPERSGLAEPLRIGAWWEDAQAIIRNALPRGVSLESSIAEDAYVRIGRPALTQLVFNLAQNAGEALRDRPEGRIRLTAERIDDRVLLTVQDNGPGMSEELAARCWEPYFTTKTRGISTGLGLVLVGGIIREAGGDVRVDSCPGEGTAFRISLPYAEPVSKTPDPERCAVVEIKDARFRALAAMELRTLGFAVHDGLNGDAPDIVVTDRALLLASHRFRESVVVLLADAPAVPSGPHLPPVFVTGPRPRPSDLREALRNAADSAARRDAQ